MGDKMLKRPNCDLEMKVSASREVFEPGEIVIQRDCKYPAVFQETAYALQKITTSRVPNFTFVCSLP